MLGITIVIPTFNRNDKLFRLIDSIYKSDRKGIKTEIIVIDNASDITLGRKIEDKFDGLVKVFTPERNLYSGGARQLGFDKANNDLIFFIDDDNILEEACIRKLIDYLLAHPDASVISPLVCYYSRPDIVWSAGGKVSNLGQIKYLFNDQPRDLVNNLKQIDFFPNSFLASKKRLQGIRFDSKNLPHNWNETDFCFNAKKVGYLETVIDAVTLHDIDYAGPLTRVGIENTFDQAKSRIVFRKKHMNSLASWLGFIFIVFPISTLVYLKAFMTQSNVSRTGLVRSYIRGTISGILYLMHG